MRILHLTLHKKWFDEILSGKKKEEYRDIKPYWTSRLFEKNSTSKKFNFILFKNGYNKNSRIMNVEFKGLTKSKGKYVIKLGKIIK